MARRKTHHSALRFLAMAITCAAILFPASAHSAGQDTQGAPSRRTRAASAYRRAERMRTALESHPGQPAASYQRVVRAFQIVYRTDPGSPSTPAALAAAAQVYEEMGRQFISDRYYSKAIDAYQFLAAQYPYGSFAADAAFAAAEIYRTDVENPVEARAAYKQFLAKFPHSTHAAAAQRQLAAIDRQLARWSSAASQTQRTASPELHDEQNEQNGHGIHRSGAPPEVTSIRHWVGPNYTRVVVRLNGPVTFNALHLEHPARLVFDLAGARLSPELAHKAFPVKDGFLERVRVAQFKPDVTRLVLDVPRIEDYSVFSLPNPFRLVIDIHGGVQNSPAALASRGAKPSPGDGQTIARPRGETGAPSLSGQIFSASNAPWSRPWTAIHPADRAANGATTTAQSGAIPPSREVAQGAAPSRTAEAAAGPGAVAQPLTAPLPSVASPTLTRALGLKIRRIVIDPGHGGKDTGTIGPTGLEEKNLVLDVALRLRKLIQRRMGCQVIMTRSTDVFIPLEERTAIANEYGADLFISIHANASHDPNARGIETYYLNFTSDPEALKLAARENASSTESVYQLQSLVKKIALSEKIDESRQFARMVDDQLVDHLDESGDPQRNRGVKKAPFVVLIGANMPSVLAEISFVSNPRDERLLRKGSYREKIAVGLYDGIVRYADSLGTVRMAERAAPTPVRPIHRVQRTRHGAPSF
ncbi:MAG: N-acetylmuramoyl-L-alanine amidase [Terriglobia bacterium]